MEVAPVARPESNGVSSRADASEIVAGEQARRQEREKELSSGAIDMNGECFSRRKDLITEELCHFTRWRASTALDFMRG